MKIKTCVEDEVVRPLDGASWGCYMKHSDELGRPASLVEDP